MQKKKKENFFIFVTNFSFYPVQLNLQFKIKFERLRCPCIKKRNYFLTSSIYRLYTVGPFSFSLSLSLSLSLSFGWTISSRRKEEGLYRGEKAIFSYQWFYDRVSRTLAEARRTLQPRRKSIFYRAWNSCYLFAYKNLNVSKMRVGQAWVVFRQPELHSPPVVILTWFRILGDRFSGTRTTRHRREPEEEPWGSRTSVRVD